MCICNRYPPPANFHPCCLKKDMNFTNEMFLFNPFFRGILTCPPAEGPKTESRRVWCLKTVNKFKKFIDTRTCVRTGGQGNKATIGWSLLTALYQSKPRETTQEACVREGCPGLTPSQFNVMHVYRVEVEARTLTLDGMSVLKHPIKYAPAVGPDTPIWVVEFTFFPCLINVRYGISFQYAHTHTHTHTRTRTHAQ